jgi:hypothetical protein
LEATISVRLFRILLIAEWVIVAVGGVVSVWSEAFLPAPLKEYVDAIAKTPYTVRDQVLLGVGMLLLLLAIVVTIGLYRLRNWARALLVLNLVLGLLGSLFYGPYVETSVGRTFSDLGVLLEGAIVALVFLPPVSGYFNGQHEV